MSGENGTTPRFRVCKNATPLGQGRGGDAGNPADNGARKRFQSGNGFCCTLEKIRIRDPATGCRSAKGYSRVHVVVKKNAPVAHAVPVVRHGLRLAVFSGDRGIRAAQRQTRIGFHVAADP